MDKYYDQKRRRKAEFIMPPNVLKAKVGSGGLSEDVLNKAQALLENQSENFAPVAENYLENLRRAVVSARQEDDEGNHEAAINAIIIPSMQIKANGGMFGYPFVSEVGEMLVHYLEVVKRPDDGCLEIVDAFYKAILAIVHGDIREGSSSHAMDLKAALQSACHRYFTQSS